MSFMIVNYEAVYQIKMFHAFCNFANDVWGFSLVIVILCCRCVCADDGHIFGRVKIYDGAAVEAL